MRFVACCCLVWAGCFYLDPINEAPTARLIPPDGPLARGAMVRFDKEFADPEHKPGSFTWVLRACRGLESSLAGIDCGDGVLATNEDTFAFTVPNTLADGTLAHAIQVTLDARDDRGALAHTVGAYEISDAVPAVAVTMSGARSVGAPLELRGRYSDGDDELATLTAVWTVVPPTPSAGYLSTALANASDDTAHVTRRQRVVAQAPGVWSVTLNVADPKGNIGTGEQTFEVLPDQPPCLAQWLPIVPPPGATLPVAAPTVFQIPLVSDDLDRYPPDTSDVLFGATEFTWSLRAPGATGRQVFADSGNSFDFDPRGFAPGSIVELRVEIADRQHTPLPCPDGEATCALAASSCLQRQTWRVEVR